LNLEPWNPNLNMPQQPHQKPRWLKKRLPTGPQYEKVKELIGKDRLHTVCQEAKCPNMWECFSHQTATFLIMGSRCTRNCRFCSIAQGPAEPPDPAEPDRVAAAARQMGLSYVVITSVTRDDLTDGGAGFFAKTIEAVHRRIPSAKVEVLIPDFQGNAPALQTVLDAHPDVLNHNIETVPRLYPIVRPQARYRRSLQLFLGESFEEIRSTLKDLIDAGCRILTLGQYLRPSKAHLPVKRFVPPAEFENWKHTALEMGFSEVASGPFVRSSYHARELYQAMDYIDLN
jgi:lipoic acid synthetase